MYVGTLLASVDSPYYDEMNAYQWLLLAQQGGADVDELLQEVGSKLTAAEREFAAEAVRDGDMPLIPHCRCPAEEESCEVFCANPHRIP